MRRIKTLITKVHPSLRWTPLPMQENHQTDTYDAFFWWTISLRQGFAASIPQKHKRREAASVFFIQRFCGVFFLKLYE
jgi:hypothetical protein